MTAAVATATRATAPGAPDTAMRAFRTVADESRLILSRFILIDGAAEFPTGRVPAIPSLREVCP